MEVSKQALQNIISDEERLLFAENIPAEYLSDALGRRTGTAGRLQHEQQNTAEQQRSE